MTDSSMNFGPAWIRNLRSEGTTTNSGGGTSGGTRYQLAEYRYGREEMLALFDKLVKPPPSVTNFKTLYSEPTLVPLALLPNTEEERGWQPRPTSLTGPPRGRGGSLERGRAARGRGGYPSYGGRAASAYDSGWGNGEQSDWSPRKEFRAPINDNWRRVRNNSEEDEGWRNINAGGGGGRSAHEKWVRSTSWRGEGDDERNGERTGNRPNWHENNRGGTRRSWDNEDHLPEWATENPTEGGGTFDERGAFHGSDDEHDMRRDGKKEMLQKSVSQQHIPHKTHPTGLSTSKSSISLSKPEDCEKFAEEPGEMSQKPDKSKDASTESQKSERKPDDANKPSERTIPDSVLPTIDKADEDFDRLQEDLVLKLVVDEETPKSNFDVGGGVQPPPNLAPPSQEKWFYQDPQGTRQGPFANVEMAEWYKAGYFSNQLNVMRECDERYFLLGELINMCGGENPFLSNIRFPVLKTESPKLPDDILPYQFLSQLAIKQQMSLGNLREPWSALTLQQQEMAAQRLLMQQQQQQQIPSDLQFMQQSTASNPLMYMINQMQQNKLPGSVLVDKPSSSVPNQLEPLLVQMHSLQNRIQSPALHNHIPSGVPSDPLNLQSSLAGLPTGLPINRPPMHSPIDQQDDALTNFLKQFQQQRQGPPLMDPLWQKPNQFPAAPPQSGAPAQWQQQPEAGPLGMWDLQSEEKILQEKEQKPKEEISQKELKKRKEQEEKQAKKEAEERRKQEQRKQEAEKKALEEKKRKEEEKIRKELEKAKKEAEEKRLRELEEKRRLKEQRKAEEEARKRSEEAKKMEEEAKRREMREREEKKQDAVRMAQNKNLSKSAPWSQSNQPTGPNLTDIQKAEKERKAQETAMHMQRQQQLLQEQQQQPDKTSGIQLNWAKKPMEQRKVKSFAEIQAEEQERMAKLSAEAKLAAQQKEKEAPVPANAGIWNGQSLSWGAAAAANAASSQWSSGNAGGGFWDDVPPKPQTKPSTTVSKSNSTSAMTTAAKQQNQKQSKTKVKKEESAKTINNNNNKDEFMDWCYKTLDSITADVDIPTFVTFLRDIESAYDVRDYCKEYLGDSPATQQFASNFLEKRRSCKPKNNAHKDDMCSPAPAITPSTQHSTEFQEVKGKNKKNKKSKMLKVDSRILGFNVTSAPDRINVGDRDYGDNS